MIESTKQQSAIAQQTTSLHEALKSRQITLIQEELHSLLSADIAHIIESFPPKIRQTIWNALSKTQRSEVLGFLSEEIASDLLQQLSSKNASELIKNIASDDVADILQELPHTVKDDILAELNEESRQKIETALDYDEDSAGGWMSQDIVTIDLNLSVQEALDNIRNMKELPKLTDALWVVDEKDTYLGLVNINKLLTTDTSLPLSAIINEKLEPILAETPIQDVANLFDRRGLISVPVVDSAKKILGRITVDDVIDGIREEASHAIMSLAHMDDDEDTFAPIFTTSRKRTIWLGVNLLTAFMASAVVWLFSETIEKVVALAVLMPIVASMGGIAGNQTLTLVIRGMALGKITSVNLTYLIRKETLVGVINGFIWCVIVSSLAFFWMHDLKLSFVIGSAMMLNLVLAAFIGAILPTILKKFDIDPALAGGVVLTTITDIIGFLSFLGLATLAYA